jgi:hypothetical protein
MNIRNFANAFTGSGVKPTLFEVQGRIGGTESPLTPFLVRAATLPGTALGTIEVPYRGRRLKVPGDRAFGDWTLSVYNDSKFQLRNLFELWVDGIQSMQRNVARNEFLNFSQPIFCDWTINQLDRTGKPVKAYTMVGCFPTEISPIEVSYDAVDQIEEFSVTLAYTYFTSNIGTPDATPLPTLTPLTPGG